MVKFEIRARASNSNIHLFRIMFSKLPIAAAVSLALCAPALAQGPIVQEAYVKASNTGAFDAFAGAVAISGDTLVVGAWQEDSDGVGPGGVQNNDNAEDAGSAYVFRRVGSNWVQEAYLKASNTEAFDGFGISVAIDGDTIVVGAFEEASGATSINGNQSDNSAPSSGAAYVFTRSGSTWTQQAYLKPSNTDAFDGFGSSVDVSGDTILVGAPRESSAATGVNGNSANNSLFQAGAAYVFSRSGSVWSQQAYLKASNIDAVDQFGFSVALDGDRAVVGAWGEDSASGGSPASNAALTSGAAYTFSRTGTVWSADGYLKADSPDAFDFFGQCVGIDGDRIVVGAKFEDSNSTAINGNALSNTASDSGAAYVFAWNGSAWVQNAYLKASNAEAGDQFGVSVAIEGDRVAVGAWGESSSSKGINGIPINNDFFHSGAAYLFRLDGPVWKQDAYVKASNAFANDVYGASVSLSPTKLVVGAILEDSSATGINGPQGNDSVAHSGASYIFDLDADAGTFCDPGIPNSTGLPATLGYSGSLTASLNNFTLVATNLPTGEFGFFLNSPGQGFIANPGGSDGHLCLGGGSFIGRHINTLQNSGATGTIQSTLDLTDMPTSSLPTVALAGETWNFQLWHRDHNPASTSNLTNGLSVRFQ